MVKSLKRLRTGTFQKSAFIFASIIIVFGLGIALGYFMPKLSGQSAYNIASPMDLAKAKDEIRDVYWGQGTARCGDEKTLSIRKDIFEKYLKVNKYANRAVIRDCSGFDSLLAKNPLTNKWERTPVNMALDARANPVWQTECLIDGITTPDDKVRSENSSIDTTNVVACRTLKERDLIGYLLQSSGQKPTEAQIREYIDGAEKFIDMVNIGS